MSKITKTDAEWIYNWIKNPEEYWPGTKMPNLRLSHQEAKDITAYLLESKNSDFENINSIKFNENELNNIAKGWLMKSYPEVDALAKLDSMNDTEIVHYVGNKSINFYGCYTCHSIDGFEKSKPIGVELTIEGSKP